MADLTVPPEEVKPLPPRHAMVEALREMVALGSDNPKMPEGVFVEFLRALYNPKTDTFDVDLWYRTFNSHRQAVDILDPAGRVIRVCPPIMGTVETQVGVARQDSLSTVVETAQLMERRHGGLAEKTMAEGLAQYKQGPNHVVHQAWRDILTYYGIIQAAPASTPQSQSTSDVWLGDVDEV